MINGQALIVDCNVLWSVLFRSQQMKPKKKIFQGWDTDCRNQPAEAADEQSLACLHRLTHCLGIAGRVTRFPHREPQERPPRHPDHS